MKAICVVVHMAVAQAGAVSPGQAHEPQDLTSLSPEELAQLQARTAIWDFAGSRDRVI
jgi:hypothetical protein